jgi:hypothetical protein
MRHAHAGPDGPAAHVPGGPAAADPVDVSKGTGGDVVRCQFSRVPLSKSAAGPAWSRLAESRDPHAVRRARGPAGPAATSAGERSGGRDPPLPVSALG